MYKNANVQRILILVSSAEMLNASESRSIFNLRNNFSVETPQLTVR